jgi:DNA-binding NtrC family response regulator
MTLSRTIQTVSAVSPRPANILVVDDYDGYRLAVAGVLEDLGYKVWTADCGRDGLDLCSRDGIRFDLIVTAMDLVDMTGRELGRRMHELHPGVRVVFTCWSDDCRRQHHVLRKPFSLLHLEHSVRRALWPREGAQQQHRR